MENNVKVTQSTIRRGMTIGNWRIVKCSPKTATIALASTIDIGARFNDRRLQLRWNNDAQAYMRQGQSLYVNGIY